MKRCGTRRMKQANACHEFISTIRSAGLLAAGLRMENGKLPHTYLFFLFDRHFLVL